MDESSAPTELGEVSAAERRIRAVQDLLKEGNLTRATLTLVPREQFAVINDYYGLDVELPSGIKKLEAEDILWEALLASDLVSQERDDKPDKEDGNSMKDELNEERIGSCGMANKRIETDYATGARPKVRSEKNDYLGNEGTSIPFSQFGSDYVPSVATCSPTFPQNFYTNTATTDDSNKSSVEIMMMKFLQRQQEQQQAQNLWFQNQCYQQQQANFLLLKQIKESAPKREEKDDLHYLRSVACLPQYSDGEDVEDYLKQFEQACKGAFPERLWARLLVIQLKGSARESVLALSEEDRNNFTKVKDAVLLKFQRIPEQYRREFRSLVKGDLSHVEFLSTLHRKVDSWLHSEQVNSFAELRELIIREAFFSKLNTEVHEYLIDKQGPLHDMAVLADKYHCLNELSKKQPRQEIINDGNHSSNPLKGQKENQDSEKGKDTLEKSKPVNRERKQLHAMCTKCGVRHKSENCPEFTKTIECYHCHKSGHLQHVCPKKKGKVAGIVNNAKHRKKTHLTLEKEGRNMLLQNTVIKQK